MKRREFIAGLGSAAVWPLAARAQQGDRVRRIGVLMGYENDTVANSLVSEFIQEFAKLGWTDGQNLRMDIRWAAGGVDRARMYAKELVGLRPEVILAHASVQTAALQQETRTIPIVFVDASDPIGSGFVIDLARIMHHMPRFCMAGPHAYCTRTPSIRPVWIGVRQLAVQRVWV